MENALKTPPKPPIHPEKTDLDTKTPTQILKLQNSGNDSPIITGSAPDRLTVPKAFKYPERYTSPTDQMMSPISKGLLARSRKPGMLLPPTKNQTKIQDLTFQEVGLSQT
ncbi:hypothetical protein Vadar_033907 [Vaccinium darrowii]|uniref:Uncharacterized protein n=1 Tax=Vaccinium darrowii TaxID=229202 RepID=A0ACB7Y5B0_9ERIC|nr:hypothetical protein Vadar_033907 [Vaccinium darrowii]